MQLKFNFRILQAAEPFTVNGNVRGFILRARCRLYKLHPHGGCVHPALLRWFLLISNVHSNITKKSTLSLMKRSTALHIGIATSTTIAASTLQATLDKGKLTSIHQAR
jgi:hypothetical protein